MNSRLLERLLAAGELGFEYYRASGPGGQNVNKVATAVRLRFDLRASALLDEETKTRLARLAGKRLTVEGALVIEAQRFRTQERNRQDALLRLGSLLGKAAARPRSRRATRPSLASQQRRLREKKEHSQVKRARQSSRRPED
ncbi:MAG: aminoacyl-tRNA hydrolase [Chloroflexi bacterium]|nr:aminoacyl-tRNA hydrolase [Chloroflexota bacterium]